MQHRLPFPKPKLKISVPRCHMLQEVPRWGDNCSPTVPDKWAPTYSLNFSRARFRYNSCTSWSPCIYVSTGTLLLKSLWIPLIQQRCVFQWGGTSEPILTASGPSIVLKARWRPFDARDWKPLYRVEDLTFDEGVLGETPNVYSKSRRHRFAIRRHDARHKASEQAFWSRRRVLSCYCHRYSPWWRQWPCHFMFTCSLFRVSSLNNVIIYLSTAVQSKMYSKMTDRYLAHFCDTFLHPVTPLGPGQIYWEAGESATRMAVSRAGDSKLSSRDAARDLSPTRRVIAVSKEETDVS